MAEFTHIELRKARESQKVTRWQLAGKIGVSEDTLRRWENGETRPEPDDIWHIEHELNMPGLWFKWMRSHHESFRENFGAMPDINSVTSSITQTRFELEDVAAILGKVERDSLDGKFDNIGDVERLKTELTEMIAAAQRTLALLPDGL